MASSTPDQMRRRDRFAPLKESWAPTLSFTLIFAILGGRLVYKLGDLELGSSAYSVALHPVLMILSAVLLSSIGTIFRKVGGYDFTKFHGIFLYVATVIAMYATYIIWEAKHKGNQDHFVSTHAQIGLVTIGIHLFVSTGSMYSLHPDFGAFKHSKLTAIGHRYAGRGIIALSWCACFTGFSSLVQIGYTLDSFLVYFMMPLGFASLGFKVLTPRYEKRE
mmetsp:Transcript_6901/g.7937  ORF Transcript_6901/g.7937 Transcript_6901/m.7937 type:complete len:220 (+) Transcript_6901:122-781(+)